MTVRKRERITHDPLPVHGHDGVLIWTVHQLSIEQLGGPARHRRATPPPGYAWHHGWFRKSDGKAFDLFTYREFPAGTAGRLEQLPPTDEKLKFQRFGNAFAAHAEDGTLYVVSLYLASWAAYHRTPEMNTAERIGQYGFPTPEEACQACEACERSRQTSNVIEEQER